MVKRYLIAILVIGAAGAYAWELRAQRPGSGQLAQLERLPHELNGWKAEDLGRGDSTEEQILGADVTLRRCYRRKDGTCVWLAVAYFAKQQVNSQIHSPRNCLPGAGWKIQALDEQNIPVNGATQPATRMLISRNSQRDEVYYWFSTRRGSVAGEYALKWDLVRSSLVDRMTNAAFVRYNAAADDSAAVRELMDLLAGPLGRILGDVGLH